MKKIFLIALLCVFAGLTSNAQDKKAEIKKLLNLMSSEKMMEQMMGNMMNIMKQQAASKDQSAESKQKAEKMFSYITEEAGAMMKKVIDEDMVDIYAKKFTEQEIKDFIAFYESPSGKKMLTELPAVTNEVMSVMMQKHFPAFQEKIKKRMQDKK